MSEIEEKRTEVAVIATRVGRLSLNKAACEIGDIAVRVCFITSLTEARSAANQIDTIHAKATSATFSEAERESREAYLAEYLHGIFKVLPENPPASPVFIRTDKPDLAELWQRAEEIADGNPIIYHPQAD